MSYKNELQKFKEFKKNYKFKQIELIARDNKIYCLGELLKDDSGFIGESSKWINASYSAKGTFPKLLSNLFPYEIKFKGNVLASLESFFQGIKFSDKNLQKKNFKYSGKEAAVLKEATNYDWKKTYTIYFNGKKYNRMEKEYDNLIDELYISAIQNKLYRNSIKNCQSPIIHALGKDKKSETVFTRYEFEFMLNCLHDFLTNTDK